MNIRISSVNICQEVLLAGAGLKSCKKHLKCTQTELGEIFRETKKAKLFLERTDVPLIPVWCDIFWQSAFRTLCCSHVGRTRSRSLCLHSSRSAGRLPRKLMADRWTHGHRWHKRLEGDSGDSWHLKYNPWNCWLMSNNVRVSGYATLTTDLQLFVDRWPHL